MAYYNQNFYNRNLTFHNIPPPPPPPKFFIPPITDQEFIKQFEKTETKVAKKAVSITQVKDEMRNLVLSLNALNEKQKIVAENIDTLTEEQWNATISEMKDNKLKIDETLSLLNDSCLENMRRALAKRCAKRLRLKKLKNERKKEMENMTKARQEQSRRIDENLQKIKDDIDKVKLDEEAKLQADSILREVLRKKHDARKWIIKLEALVKLRKARLNSAKGRREQVSEKDEPEFNTNVEKLISLWNRKLSSYETEELELRDKLKASQPTTVSKAEEGIEETLHLWKQVLFEGEPQFDFKGDIGGFLAVRAQWDQFISKEGTSLPTGWVVPNLT